MPNPTPLNNVTGLWLAAAHLSGADTLVLNPGAGDQIRAAIAELGADDVSTDHPLRATVAKVATVNSFGQIHDRTQLCIFDCTGLSGDTLSGLTVREGKTDLGFAVGDRVGFFLTADMLRTASAGGPINSSQLPSSGVAPGAYALASVVVDAKGRVTSATDNGAAVVKVTGNQDIGGQKRFLGTATTNANVPLVTLETGGTYEGPGLDIKKTQPGGNFGLRYFSPYLLADPVVYIGDNGGLFTRMPIVGSSNHTGTGENYRINPPTLDQTWIGIWSDIDVAVQVRDSGNAGSRSYETLDTTGKYVYAVMNADGKLRWGATTSKDGNGTPLYDTNLYRASAGVLKTDGAFQVVGDLIAPTINGAVSVTGYIRTDQQVQFGDNLTYITESGGLKIVGGPRDISLNAGGVERVRIKNDTGEVVNNSTHIHNFGAGGNTSNQFIKCVPHDPLTTTTYNFCITENTDPFDPSGRKDVILSFGLNDNGNGAAVDPTQITVIDAIESKWNGKIERHIAAVRRPDGNSIRAMTMTVDFVTLETEITSQVGLWQLQDDGDRNVYVKFSSDGLTNPSNSWLFTQGVSQKQALALVCDGSTTTLDFGAAGAANTFNMKGTAPKLTFASGSFGPSVALQTDGTTPALFVQDISAAAPLASFGAASDPIFGAGNSRFKLYSGAKVFSFNVQGLASVSDGTKTSLWAPDSFGTFSNTPLKLLANNATAATVGTDGSLAAIGAVSGSAGSFTGNVLVNTGGTAMLVGAIGALPGFRGLWFESTQTSSNYGIIGKAGQTLMNVGAGGFLGFLVGNSMALQVDGTTTAVSGTLTVGGGTPVSKFLSATATLDFPSTAAQSSADLTVALTGAAVGDAVALGLPAAPAANTAFTAWVSASNTVTVRHSNYSSGAVDPASGVYRVAVIKF